MLPRGIPHSIPTEKVLTKVITADGGLPLIRPRGSGTNHNIIPVEPGLAPRDWEMEGFLQMRHVVESIRVDGYDRVASPSPIARAVLVLALVLEELLPGSRVVESDVDAYFVDDATLGGAEGGGQGEVRLFQDGGEEGWELVACDPIGIVLEGGALEITSSDGFVVVVRIEAFRVGREADAVGCMVIVSQVGF